MGKKISDLTEKTAMLSTDVIPIVGSTGTQKITAENARSYFVEQAYSQLSEAGALKVDKGGSGQVTYANLAQDARTAMTGGSTAVVGVNAVLEANITDVAVTNRKLKSRKVSRNLFDIDSYSVYNGYNASGAFVSNASSFAIYIPVSPSTTYTIHRSLTLSNRFNICGCANIPVGGGLYGSYVSSASESATITTGASENYLYVWLYYGTLAGLNLATLLNSFQIEKGTTYTGFREHFIMDIKADNMEDSIAQTLNLSLMNGKTINIIGDSFTENSPKWHTYIANKTKCLINNYGLAGSSIVDYPTPYSDGFLTRYPLMVDTCDAVVIFGGINDSWALSTDRCTVGTISSTETTTIYGAVKALCDGLITKYPTKPIVALLPPNIINNASTYAHSQNIDVVCEILKEVYTKYGIPFLDLRSESTISTVTAHNTLYVTNPTTDMHWNALAHERASYSIQRFLERYIH